MKLRYLLIPLLLNLFVPLGLWAQATDSLRLKLDAVFAHLDKSQIPTAFLMPMRSH